MELDDDRKPTIQNHLSRHTPLVNWAVDDTWKWPNWKIGYDADTLFNELHAEFNSIQCAIQDPHSWHLDVCEIAVRADNRDEFRQLLRKRQEERYEEIQRAWDRTRAVLTGDSMRWDVPQKRHTLWLRLAQISRHFSYNSILRYFSSYVNDESDPTPNPPAIEQHQPQQQRQAPIDTESEERTSDIFRNNLPRRDIIAERVDGPVQPGAARASKAKEKLDGATLYPNRVIKRRRPQRRPRISTSPEEDGLADTSDTDSESRGSAPTKGVGTPVRGVGHTRWNTAREKAVSTRMTTYSNKVVKQRPQQRRPQIDRITEEEMSDPPDADSGSRNNIAGKSGKRTGSKAMRETTTAAKEKASPDRGTRHPNGIVKRRPQQRKTNATHPSDLRRSVRLRDQAKHGSR
ncbi:hypothetical protein SAMD00023353_3000820 [Rosellinia necatrix]|uniref:Uncharacterized protein n=1 Tax=Rosellinia necatrix TaxID=77044 RepID=A0A1W2TJA0_ROSNE|nr:hypothetical protein SAMD00023353_3000820 [Rosellinia necatrix]